MSAFRPFRTHSTPPHSPSSLPPPAPPPLAGTRITGAPACGPAPPFPTRTPRAYPMGPPPPRRALLQPPPTAPPTAPLNCSKSSPRVRLFVFLFVYSLAQTRSFFFFVSRFMRSSISIFELSKWAMNKRTEKTAFSTHLGPGSWSSCLSRPPTAFYYYNTKLLSFPFSSFPLSCAVAASDSSLSNDRSRKGGRPVRSSLDKRRAEALALADALLHRVDEIMKAREWIRNEERVEGT